MLLPQQWQKSSRFIRVCPACQAHVKVAHSSFTNCFQHIAHKHADIESLVDKFASNVSKNFLKGQHALNQARERKRKREDKETDPQPGQLKLLNRTLSTEACEHVNRALLKFLVSNNVPIRTLDSRAFKEFIKTLLQMADTEVHWAPPSRRTLARELGMRRDKIMLYIQDLLIRAEANSCVLFHDGWTDALNRYWLLICLRIDEQYFVVSAGFLKCLCWTKMWTMRLLQHGLTLCYLSDVDRVASSPNFTKQDIERPAFPVLPSYSSRSTSALLWKSALPSNGSVVVVVWSDWGIWKPRSPTYQRRSSLRA